MEENRGKPDCQEELNLFQLLKEKVFVDWNQLNEWEKKFIEMPVGDMYVPPFANRSLLGN